MGTPDDDGWGFFVDLPDELLPPARPQMARGRLLRAEFRPSTEAAIGETFLLSGRAPRRWSSLESSAGQAAVVSVVAVPARGGVSLMGLAQLLMAAYPVLRSRH